MNDLLGVRHVAIPSRNLKESIDFYKEVDVIILAHGSHDPRWCKPFHGLLELARNQLSASIHVELAYMEMASPTLEETAFKILNQETKSCLKIKTIYIAPFFMAQGAHLRNDVPLQVSALRQRYPEIQFELHSAIGEDPPVQHEMIERLGRLI